MIDIDLQFKREEFELHAGVQAEGFLGITGENGTGKTTFLKIIAGILDCDSGHVIINGRDVTSLPINERKAVYLNPDTFFGHLDVDRHLVWGVESGKRENLSKELLEIKQGLGISYTGKVAGLSVGQRARTILGTALLAVPEVILIDELFANISDRGKLIEFVKSHGKSHGIDILFTSQEAGDLKMADSNYVMSGGNLSKSLQD